MAKRRPGQQWDNDDRNGSRGGRGGNNDSRAGSGGGTDDNYVTDMLIEAQALQGEGRIDEAIELCEELVATYGRPDARYYLAWMYQEEHVWDGAIEHYTALLDDLDYALSCYYALGQCYRAKADLKTAVHYFDEAVDRVNLDALNRDEADQLIQLCHEAAKTHDDLNDIDGSDTVYSALLGFLRSRGWNDRVAEVEKLMAERRPGGAVGGNQRIGNSGVMPAVNGGNSAAAAAAASRAGFLGEASRGLDQTFGHSGAAAMSGLAGLTPAPPLPAIPMPPLPITPTPQQPAAPFGQPNPYGQPVPYGQPSPYAQPSPFGQAPAYMPTNPVPGLGTIGGLGGTPLSGIGRLNASPPALPEPQRSQVMHAMREVENYISHGLYTAAIEECIRIIEVAPQYLDVHQALAEIYVQQGKVDQAITKYAILIDTFLVNGRIDEAIAAYRRILYLEPNNLTYRVRFIDLLAKHGRADDMLSERVAAAESYLKMGYPERAIEQFEQALLTWPTNLSLRMSYALALVRAGKVNQGIGELQRILQIEPNNTLALARWQIALCSGAGSLSSSGGLAQSAIRMMPGDGTPRVAALEILGRVVRTLRADAMHNYDEVLREYQSAIEISPTNGDLRYSLAVIFHAANRSQDAVANYQAAATTPGLDVLAHVGSAMALLSSGDTSSASAAVRVLEEANAAIRRTPVPSGIWAARPRLDGEDAISPDMEIAQMLARAYSRTTNAPMNALAGYPTAPNVSGSPSHIRPANTLSDELYRAINEINARHPNDTPGALVEMVQLVRHYRGQRQFEQAVIILNEITRIAPEDASVRAELADIHITRGLLEEGIEELRRVVEIYMRHNQIAEASATLQQIGEIQWQSGQQEIAMTTLKQVLNLTPDDMGTRMVYVQYCLELGLRKEASEQQTVLARYYYHSRQTREAVAMLQQLIALDKDNFEAYDLLGQTYFSVGEYDQAQRVYRHLAKINPSSNIARERLAQIQEMRVRR